MAGKDAGTGGIQLIGIGDVLKGVGAENTIIRVRDVGDEPHMGRALQSFQHRIARHITGRQYKLRGGEEGLGVPTDGYIGRGGGV